MIIFKGRIIKILTNMIPPLNLTRVRFRGDMILFFEISYMGSLPPKSHLSEILGGTIILKGGIIKKFSLIGFPPKSHSSAAARVRFEDVIIFFEFS